MSSDGGWDAFFRLLARMPARRQEPPTPEPLSSTLPAANKPGEAVLEFFEAVRVHEDLVEYHGGGQEAHTYLLALGYLGQVPDEALEKTLRRTIRQHSGELELERLWSLLDRHKRRIASTGPDERVDRVSSGFRQSYGSYREALNTLHDYYREDETEVLKDAIRDEVCSEGAWLLLDKDIRREVGNRIRREETKAKKNMYAVPLFLPDDLIGEDKDTERVDLQAFDAAELLQRLMNRARLSAQEREALFALGRMTSKEAAKELGRSPEQLRQEKLRSVKKLRRAAEL